MLYAIGAAILAFGLLALACWPIAATIHHATAWLVRRAFGDHDNR